jgi:hypothetical protein
MAISVPSQSTQYANSKAKPIIENFSYDWGAKLRASMCKLTFTAAGFTTDEVGDISLITMPAGKIRILPTLSYLVCPQGSATSLLDLGIGPYKDKNGATVGLAGKALGEDLAVGAGALAQAINVPAAGYLEIESQAGFDIVASFDVANSPASGELFLLIVYMQGN